MRTNTLIQSNRNSFFLIAFCSLSKGPFFKREGNIDYISGYSFYLKINTTTSDWYCNATIPIRMSTSRPRHTLCVLESIRWLMYHQFSNRYAVTPHCYHSHLIFVTSNVLLIIYVLQGFQS